MSKAGKGRKHEEKMKKRRATKAAKAAKYLALRGTSKKSKRQGSKSQVSGANKHAHVMVDCGNPGCKHCYPMVA